MKARDRQEIIKYLSDHRNELEQDYSLESIGIIGSIARGDYSALSDVDLMVRFKPETERIRDKKRALSESLESIFGRPVQVTSEKFLKPYYKETILREAVYVR